MNDQSRWGFVQGVTCVVCPDCAFTFSAEHTDSTPQGGYSCPNCENITTEVHSCPTCSGEGTVIETRPLANSNYRPCPDCTPDNVKEPT